MSTFHLTENRVSLSSLLTPRCGYELSNGIVCTFTLDFETVLNVFYSLGMKDEIAADVPAQAKLELLMGINRYADKLSFYCNDCAINPPRKQEQKIFAGLIDRCIFEVNPEKASSYPRPEGSIFHPKIWLLFYEPTQDAEQSDCPYIKLIVSSRNLTKSSNLDYAIAMDADVKDHQTIESAERTKPLTDWLEYLKPFTTSDEKLKNLDSLQEIVAKTDMFRWDKNNAYSSCWFYPLGIFEEYNKDKLNLFGSTPKKYKDWLVVVSPFLGKECIRELTENADEQYAALLTRRESLTPEIAKHFNKIYGLKPQLYNDELIENSDSSDSNDNSESPDQFGVIRDVHAKLYIYHSGGQNYLLLGSANATDQAFNKNVEFMLQLQFSHPRAVNYDSICTNLFQFKDGKLSDDSPFVEIKTDEIKNTTENKEDSFVFSKRRDIGNKIQKAEVQPNGDMFDIVITTEGNFEEPIKIAPVNAEKGEVELTAETRISGLSINQLSNFYIISTPNDRFIKIIDTQNMPMYEERSKAIVNTIINDQTDFYKMVELILANVPTSVVQREMHKLDNALGSQEGKNAYIPKGIYERALQLAALNDKPFEELMRLIDALPNDDDPLKNMFKTINDALVNAKKNK